MSSPEDELIEFLKTYCGPMWASYWNIYEGLCWLKAFAEHGLTVSVIDPDLKGISFKIANYRAWRFGPDSAEARRSEGKAGYFPKGP